MAFKNRRLIVALVTVVVVVVVSVAIWEFYLRDSLSAGESTEYTISISCFGAERESVGLSDLETLPQFSYEDVLGSGATDTGPLLRDAILLRIQPSELSNDTAIVIGSSLTLQERTLTWQEIQNESKLYILDFTKRGTVKFTSPDTPKNQRVKDVTYIRVGA